MFKHLTMVRRPEVRLEMRSLPARAQTMVLWAPETAGPWSAVTIRHISMNWQAYLGNLCTKRETVVIWRTLEQSFNCNHRVKRLTSSGTTEAPEFLPGLSPTWRPRWWACLRRWAPGPSRHRYWSWRKRAYGSDPAPARQKVTRRRKVFSPCTFFSIRHLKAWFVLRNTHSCPGVIHWYSGRRHLFGWLDNSFGNEVIIDGAAGITQTIPTNSSKHAVIKEFKLA